MELLYVAGSHSLAPDVFEVAEAGEGKDVAGKLEAARTLDPEASGEEGAGGCGRACMRAARGARLWGRSAKVQPRGWRLGAPCALPGRPSLACLAAPCALAPTGCSNPSAPAPSPPPAARRRHERRHCGGPGRGVPVCDGGALPRPRRRHHLQQRGVLHVQAAAPPQALGAPAAGGAGGGEQPGAAARRPGEQAPNCLRRGLQPGAAMHATAVLGSRRSVPLAALG